MQRGRQFFPSPADGIDVPAREPGDEPIPTVPELGTLDGGVPASLLLIEPTEQEIHLPVDLLVGMMIQAEAVGALALMDFLLRHGLTLRDSVTDCWTPGRVYQKAWKLFLDGPKEITPGANATDCQVYLQFALALLRGPRSVMTRCEPTTHR